MRIKEKKKQKELGVEEKMGV
jgi:hypothetical protein